MKYGKNLIGDVYGRLTVLSLHSNINYRKKFLCACTCGAEKVVAMTHLRTGHTTSCGCYKKEITPRLTHGKAKTPLYKVYYAMLGRCHNPKDSGYYKYGAVGRSVCTVWREGGYEVFEAWALANGYEEGLSIDRKDNEGNYSPDNCRWVNAQVQAVNRGIQKNNTSKYKGVNYHKGKSKWIARITFNGKRIELGTFTTPEEANESRVAFIKENEMHEHTRALAYD